MRRRFNRLRNRGLTHTHVWKRGSIGYADNYQGGHDKYRNMYCKKCGKHEYKTIYSQRRH